MLRCYNINIDCINEIDLNFLEYSLSDSSKTLLLLAATQVHLTSFNFLISNKLDKPINIYNKTYFQHFNNKNQLLLKFFNNNIISRILYSKNNFIIETALTILSINNDFKSQNNLNLQKYTVNNFFYRQKIKMQIYKH